MKDVESVRKLLKKEMSDLLGEAHPIALSGMKPFVILAVGVNGVGKTTTIGKLAIRFRSQGLSVLLAQEIPSAQQGLNSSRYGPRDRAPRL